VVTSSACASRNSSLTLANCCGLGIFKAAGIRRINRMAVITEAMAVITLTSADSQ
jgi:hypothetical protein